VAQDVVVLLVRLGWYGCIEMMMEAMVVGKGEVTVQGDVCPPHWVSGRCLSGSWDGEAVEG
jgi:hypothetical protein